MIFLQDNVRLDRELTHDDIKPRLLGRHSGIAGNRDRATNWTRSLGNMPWVNSDIFSPELLHSETSFGYAICGGTGAWGAGYSSFPVD